MLANTSIEMDLVMLFLAFSNADFKFGDEKLTWRFYTAAEALPTTSRVKFIDKRKFAKAVLDGNSEIFLIHVDALEVPIPIPIYSCRAPQVLDNPTLAAQK